MTKPMIPQPQKKKTFRAWLLGALAVISAFFAGLFAVRHRENEDADPHFGEAPSDYLNNIPGDGSENPSTLLQGFSTAAVPLCTVDIPNLTEAQAKALEACYPQAVRLNPKEVPAG